MGKWGFTWDGLYDLFCCWTCAIASVLDYMTYFPNITSPILENQMERKRGNEMDTGIICGFTTQILMDMGSL